MVSRLRLGLRQVARMIQPFLRLPPLRVVYSSGVRHAAARRIRRELRTSHPGLAQAIDAIQARWGGAVAGSPADTPIFLFGAGWRCGSTWVQRLLMSSGQALIWGEPFDRSCILQTMSGQLLPLGPSWPPDKW